MLHLFVFSQVKEEMTYPDHQPCLSRSTSGSNLRQISLLERLNSTLAIWCLSQVGRTGAVHFLKDRDTGVSVVVYYI